MKEEYEMVLQSGYIEYDILRLVMVEDLDVDSMVEISSIGDEYENFEYF